jgi:tetratricopeptide (TPR) repeat protein
MSGQHGGAVAFSFVTVPLESKAGTVTLAYLLDIDGTSLFGEQPGVVVPVEVVVYAMAAGGGVSASSSLVVDADPGVCPAVLSPAGLRVVGALSLPESEHALRVLVRNTVTGDFGVAELPRALPALGEGGALLATPLGVEPAVWALAVEEGSAEVLRPVLAPTWLEAGMTVSTRPVVGPGMTLPLLLPARGVSPGTRTATTRVLDRQGKEVASGELAMGSRETGALGSLDLWKVEWKVPDLPPELYFLEVTAPGVLAGSKVVGTVPCLLVEAANTPSPAVWAALDGVVVPEETSRRAAYQAGRGRKGEANPKVKAGYRAALMQLKTGGLDAAVAAVADLERPLLASGSSGELEGVIWAELQVARDLAGSRPESALSLTLLHMKLYDRYARARELLPMAHTRRILEALTELWLDRSRRPETRSQAADLLANLAATLQDAGLDATAARLFKRSIDVDKGCAAGLIGMAAGLERSGAYRPAVRFLEQLVDAHPDHAEGKLRLAVNHLRVGSAARAERLLDSCLGSDAPPWVRIVAYQELARVEVGKGRLDAASSLLGRARREGLEDEQIRLFQAFLLDRQNRTREAYDMAATVTAVPTGSEGSARLRYSQWPRDDREVIRRRLDEAAPAAWETLREAVGALRWEAGS